MATHTAMTQGNDPEVRRSIEKAVGILHLVSPKERGWNGVLRQRLVLFFLIRFCRYPLDFAMKFHDRQNSTLQSVLATLVALSGLSSSGCLQHLPVAQTCWLTQHCLDTQTSRFMRSPRTAKCFICTIILQTPESSRERCVMCVPIIHRDSIFTFCCRKLPRELRL